MRTTEWKRVSANVSGFLILLAALSQLVWANEAVQVKDIFSNTRAVIYAIWPCRVEGDLVVQSGSVSDLNVLGLRKPSLHDKEWHERWFKNPPSFPFVFDPKKADALVESLQEDENIINSSVLLGEDVWGRFITFKLKEHPEVDVRRYPTFIVVLSSRLRKPFRSRSEHIDQSKQLIDIIQDNFAKETSLAEGLNTVRGSWVFHRYPLLVVTHIDDLDEMHYIGHLQEGLSVNEYWSADDLVQMGVLPHRDYVYPRVDLGTFLAHHVVSGTMVRIVVAERPYFIEEGSGLWHIAGPLNRHLERLIRYINFVHVLIPSSLADTDDQGMDEADAFLNRLIDADSSTEVKRAVAEFSAWMAAHENGLEELNFLVNEIETTMSVLDDAMLWEEQATGEGDFDLHSKGFGDKYFVPLRETGLSRGFILAGLSYGLGANHLYDTRKTLHEKKQMLEKEIRARRFQVQRIKSDFNQRLSVATAVYSVKSAIWQSWLSILIGLVVSGIAITVFEDDLKSKLRPCVLNLLNRFRRKNFD